MAAALGLDLAPGDVLVSIGTSGVASAVSRGARRRRHGAVTGFADATGGFLPLVTTINAARILDLQARLLGVDHDELAALALAAPAGSDGVTLLPYFDGERTPNRPDATGTWTGLTPRTTRADLARAAFEGLLCSLADAVDRSSRRDRQEPRRVLMVGGATPVGRRARAGAGHPRPPGRAPGAGGVRRPRRRPAGRVGARRHRCRSLAGPADAETLEADPTPGVRERVRGLRDR